ncbi:hypothetical protein CASFOL_031436 [Castilleja foliolosa]|uniref:PGG domain-containing protein n=1 Tax=Castilleja foliolosa TaxID=1961234 RepID=A0ABD3C5K6_9LAMI
MGRLDLQIELESYPSSSPKDEPRNDNVKKPEKKLPASKIQPDDHHESQSNEDPVSDIYTDYGLYLAAKNGSLDDFAHLLARVSASQQTPPGDILRRASPVGNTFIHVAAKHGKDKIVTFIAENDPSVVLVKNHNRETALHVAAKTGHLSVVNALLAIRNAELEDNSVLREMDEIGNTALHVALINGRDLVARCLVQKDPEGSYCVNNKGESALYLAAKVGSARCVSLILQLSTDQGQVNELFTSNSAIHAAVERKDRDVLEAMLKTNPSFARSRDNEGRTPLHLAASLGYLEEVRYLLRQYAPSATRKDKKGLLPIHLATIKGHVDIVRLLLRDCPDSGELLDNDGRNILHLAARNGRCNVVKYILGNRDLDDLINMKDKKGNTSLHLSAMFYYPKIASALTWDDRVDITSVNDIGMTALDVSEYYYSWYDPTFCQGLPREIRLTWAALKSAGTPRSPTASKHTSKKKSPSTDRYKDRVNTLLLVATLVATVTFAAGFTMPGGYNTTSGSSDLGMATMSRSRVFRVFVFCDTLAMYSSILVAVALSWAQLGDLNLVLNALTIATPLLSIALSMMSMAFTAGVYLAVRELKWLSTAVFVMGIVFLAILLVLVVPLCAPLASTNRVLRYLSYYPFLLLALASSS